MILKKTPGNDYGATPQIHIEYSSPRPDRQQALLQAKNHLNFLARSLEGIAPGTPLSKITPNGGPNVLKRVAEFCVTNELPFKEVARVLYELGEAGKLPRWTAERYSTTMDLLAEACWHYGSTSYNTER